MRDRVSILIVDDNRTSLALMDLLARKLPGASTQLRTDAALLARGLDQVSFDAAIIEHHGQGMDGLALARSLAAHQRHAGKPVIIVSADPDEGLRQRALEAGAAAVLRKPIRPVDFRATLARLLRPSPGVQAETPQGPGQTGFEEELIGAVARAAAYKDREPPLHAARMARYCAILAHHLGLPEETCVQYRLAAPLHDIGKAGLRDDVLQNRGLLSEEQRRHMAEHTRIGHAILSAGRSSVMRLAAEIALSHHERWDGKGYPKGLRGEDIPLPGRIAAVADVFDALTSVRPYKCAWSTSNAFDYLAEHAGEQFDPRCIAAFEMGREEVEAVMSLMPDLHAETDADAA